MINLDELYFDWLLKRLDSDGVAEKVAYLCDLLHQFSFKRRVGNDLNRAADGVNLRKAFMDRYEDAGIDSYVINNFMMHDCSWLEMLVALSDRLDFLYDGGVEGRFTEIITNLGLKRLTLFGHEPSDEDLDYVEAVVSNVDRNRFDRNGFGGMFPLVKDGHPDQRRVEIWDQQGAYFIERFEGVLWTSIM